MKATLKTSKPLPTLKELVDKYDGNVKQGIKEISDLSIPSKYVGSKPYLKKDHTTQEARDYVQALETYEQEAAEIREYNKSISEHNKQASGLLYDFIKESTGLNSIVPARYREKVWARAWDLGHSSGLSEVHNYLIDLVEIFE
jgi:hypothetical protein